MKITSSFSSVFIAMLAMGQSHAASIALDFESAALGATVPAGWQTVGVGANGAYETTAATGNPGQSGNLDWTSTETISPSVYLVNSGDAFDATKAISGTFNFYLTEVGNYSTANFIIGDVQNGINAPAGNSGEFINVWMTEQQFGTRARVYDSDNTVLFNGDGNNAYAFRTEQWVAASFTWTPTSGMTGDFSVLLNSPSFTNSAMTVTGYTFDSANIFFGFGTGDAPVRFDNISITGTAIPEPSAAIMGTLGLLALMRRRR